MALALAFATVADAKAAAPQKRSAMNTRQPTPRQQHRPSAAVVEPKAKDRLVPTASPTPAPSSTPSASATASAAAAAAAPERSSRNRRNSFVLLCMVGVAIIIVYRRAHSYTKRIKSPLSGSSQRRTLPRNPSLGSFSLNPEATGARARFPGNSCDSPV